MRLEKLSTLCKISNGYAFKSDDYVNNGYRVIRITNVQKGFVVDDDPKFIPNEIADKVGNFKLNTGDILVSLTGNVGRVGRILQQHLPAVLNQRVGLIRPASSEINEKYLFQFLNSEKFEREAIKNSNGVAQLNLSTKWIENHEIPLPPLNDQIHLAYLLDKVESLITHRKQHLQQLDDLLKSVFLEMFGDPIRNEKHHKISTLAPYITHLTSGGRGWAEYYSSSGKRFLRSLDVQMNAIGSNDVAYVIPPNNKESERTRVTPGDVLLTITGSKIGRVCFVPKNFEEAYISQHVAIIRTKGINPIYLSFYLSMPNCGQRIIAQRQYGQAKPGLNLTQIQNFEIIDPDKDLQDQFAAIFEKIESIKSLYQKSFNDLESLYGALSQKAFKGELDLSKIPLIHEAQTEAIEEGFLARQQETSKGFSVNEYANIANLINQIIIAPPNSLIDKQGNSDAWLDAYIQYVRENKKQLDIKLFLQVCSEKWNESFQFDQSTIVINNYDKIKDKIFKKLHNTELVQKYNEKELSVSLTLVKQGA